MILVAGATGVLGMEICHRLRDRGDKVRALVRGTSADNKVMKIRWMGVSLIRGDLRDPISLKGACEGADVVISTVSMIVTGQPGDSFEHTDAEGTINLIDAAKAAGTKQFIFVSVPWSNLPDSPLADAKRRVEEHLKASGIPYTILQPTYFMESWLGPMIFGDPATGAVKVFGAGTHKISYVAVADVAEVAVRCVGDAEALNATITFGSPEQITQREAVGIFEEVFDKPFTVTEVPEAALEAQWSSAADPMTRTFSALMLGLARGGFGIGPGAVARFPIQWKSVRDYVSHLRGG